MGVNSPDLLEMLKLVVAYVMGVVIGYERELEHRPAGVKVFSIVTLTSAMLMVLSMRIAEVNGAVDASGPARVVAAIMTGIGFLGAGVIIQTGSQIQGITTASLIWLMAGVGLCVGAGMYWLAVLAVALTWLGLRLDPFLQHKIAARESRRQKAQQ